MNLETVNELIHTLESAGELTIREEKFLKLAKAYVQLAAENVGLKQIVDSVTDLDNEPQYHHLGMGCGLEDRGITDRYEAMRYGWDEAMERVYGEVIPCADELDFSATDRIYAGAKADGVEMVIKEFFSANTIEASSMKSGLQSFAKQLREGAK
ncbi:TPA: hypothetical protein ACGATL_000253 [Raoultella ornithinolytica]